MGVRADEDEQPVMDVREDEGEQPSASFLADQKAEYNKPVPLLSH